MNQGTIITWNFANWVTVVIMVGLAFAIVGAGTRIIQSRQQTQSGS